MSDHDEIMQYPCEIAVKAMGRTDLDVDFEAVVVEIVRRHAPDIGEGAVSTRESRNGNYLAVTYRCETDSAIAENWFAVAERAKQVHGKRQDVETQREVARPSARVREVAVLPPEHLIDLPLVDGWQFSEGAADSVRQIRYRLRRIE